MSNTEKPLHLTVWAIVAALLVSCGAPREPVVAQGLEPLPSSSAVAWVTYGDHVVVARVTSERRLPIDADEQRAGEGSISREVALSVEQVAWSRKGAPVEAPPHLVWAGPAWSFDADGERPLRLANVPRLEIGHDYLIPITHIPKGDQTALLDRWIPLGPANQLPFDDGVVGRGETVLGADGKPFQPDPGRPDATIRDKIWGAGLNEVRLLLDQRGIDPAAATHMDLPPLSRYAATQSR